MCGKSDDHSVKRKMLLGMLPLRSILFFYATIILLYISQSQCQPKVGSPCDLPNNRQGICRPVTYCREGFNQLFCASANRGHIQYVCCPDSILPGDYGEYKHNERHPFRWFSSSSSKDSRTFLNLPTSSTTKKPSIGTIMEFGSFSYTVRENETENVYSEEVPSLDDRNVFNNPEHYQQKDKRQFRLAEIMCKQYTAAASQSDPSVLALGLSVHPVPVLKPVGKCSKRPLELIIGGEEADRSQYPHMAAVGFLENDRRISWHCGGSLVSEYFILTAAHCTRTSYGQPYLVRLGNLNLSPYQLADDYLVDYSLRHPDYNLKTKYDDIGLIRLKRRVEFTNSILPACLDTKPQVPETRATAAGWGITANNESPSNHLLKVVLPIVDQRTCNRLYESGSSSISLKHGITDSLLCAGELAGGKDTCQGDSGGPLMVVREDNQCRLHYVIGVTAFGKFCGAKNSPGVYTRVSWYTRWLEENIWPDG